MDQWQQDAGEEAHKRYSDEISRINAKFYPTDGLPLVGDRQAYLKEWGAAGKRYYAEMKRLGFPNYEWRD